MTSIIMPPAPRLATLTLLLLSAVMAACKETYCPPPVKRFLRINNKIYRKMNGAIIHMNEVPQEEVVRLSLRPNPYYSSPKCGVLESETGKGFSHFGVREEYDLQSFRSAAECEVYLARPGLGAESVELRVMVITDLVAGLSSECRPQVAVRVALTVNFCAEEWSCSNTTTATTTTEAEGEGDYEAEYVTNCDSEWGCEAAEAAAECPGEWGCLDTDFGSKTVVGVGEEVVEEDGDLVTVILNTLLSERMTPVTISVLVLVALLLLLAMGCLLCRGTTRCTDNSVKKPRRSESVATTLTSVTSERTISGPLPLTRQGSLLTRQSSARSSTQSVRSLREVKVVKLTDSEAEEARGHGDTTAAAAVTEDVEPEVSKHHCDPDPTEDGLESLEWCSNIRIPGNKKSKIKTKHKRKESASVPSIPTIPTLPSPYSSYELPDEDDDYHQQSNIKLPEVVAKSYRMAQKDIPVTFY